MTDPKAAAERKQNERDRQREAGRVVVQVWIDPRDRARLLQYVKRINRQRTRP